MPRLDHVVEARIRERADEVVEAIHYASGVYFPKRAHATRVSIKKLRYLLEFSAAPDESALKVLRKSQQILGDAQDRQVLYDAVRELGKTAAEDDLEPLLAQVQAEGTHLYDRFLQRRPEVLAVCQSLAAELSGSRPRVLTGTVVMLAAIAAGSAWRGSRPR
jgi:CHAD domain-containing protein